MYIKILKSSTGLRQFYASTQILGLDWVQTRFAKGIYKNYKMLSSNRRRGVISGPETFSLSGKL